MATLNGSQKKKIHRMKIRLTFILSICGLIFFPYLAGYFDLLLLHELKNKEIKLDYYDAWKSLFINERQQTILFLLVLIFLIGVLMFFTKKSTISKADTVRITKDIYIPVAIGDGQFGTSRFLKEEEKKELFTLVSDDGSLPENPGIVIGKKKDKVKELIYCINEDVHCQIIGSTRSGKSRRIILQTIWLRGKSGKNMVLNDPKGELYLYTSKYLVDQGYEVIVLDFNNPLKGSHYNYMQNINDAIEKNDVARAIDYTWDLVSVLVGIPKGEPLWANGESAVIVASILAIALEAPKEFRNLTNAYYFIAYMCTALEGKEMPITRYFRELPDTHPAKGVFAVAEISPERTRGSFFGSALGTLRLFTNWNIADMTSSSDFSLKDLAKKKTALYIIVPDEKATMYSLVSLMINQIYISLVEVAKENGGRVPTEIDFLLDEFGNMPPIPGFGGMMSVGAGRGMRFTTVLQDYQQMEKNYQNESENIKGNSQVTIYLKSPTVKTLEELSKRTGKYTIQVNSKNDSISGKNLNQLSYSDGVNMQARDLLLSDEVGRIQAPYSLVLYSGNFAGIFYSPDLSDYKANHELGLGTKEMNQKISIEREAERSERQRCDMKLWGIWSEYRIDSEEDKELEESEEFSFINLD